ncbi:transcription factor PCL1-like [Solanum lycopersicum]|uniref:transcription factor PCL1-like n=1 Tax=Solanum lycopersicum TaxID=4081 RepID=UPI0008FEB5A8|nr:putative two-component response regulator ARR20 isoform X2 [Solanum lycopersicum]
MEERKERRLRIKWTPNVNKKFNEAIRRLGEKATAIPILEYMNVPQLTRKQVENRLQQYRESESLTYTTALLEHF